MKRNYAQISIITAAVMLPIAMIIGQLVAWYYKSTNPNDVDITAGLAYLRQILLTSIAVFLVLWIVSLLTGIAGLRTEMKKAAKLGLILLCINSVMCLGLAGLNKINSNLIDHAEQVKAAENK